MDKPKLALVYIRNGRETVFPVKGIEHALILADAIADSDLLNDTIDFNMFDVCYYDPRNPYGDLGYSWLSPDLQEFNEYWRERRNKDERL